MSDKFVEVKVFLLYFYMNKGAIPSSLIIFVIFLRGNIEYKRIILHYIQVYVCVHTIEKETVRN